VNREILLVREALLDTSNALVPGTMSEKSAVALQALEALRARVAEAEGGGDVLAGEPYNWRLACERATVRAEAAEDESEALRGLLIQAENALRGAHEWAGCLDEPGTNPETCDICAALTHSPEGDSPEVTPKSAVDGGAAGSPEGRTEGASP
jgi:hypothetical protein